MGEPEMDLSNQEYDALVRSKAKPSPLWKDLAWAFCVGGGTVSYTHLTLPTKA